MSVQELAKFVLVVQSSYLEENFYIIYIKMLYYIAGLPLAVQCNCLPMPPHHHRLYIKDGSKNSEMLC